MPKEFFNIFDAVVLTGKLKEARAWANHTSKVCLLPCSPDTGWENWPAKMRENEVSANFAALKVVAIEEEISLEISKLPDPQIVTMLQSALDK